jgi:hypothetical protein
MPATQARDATRLELQVCFFFVILFCSTTLMFILGHSTYRNGNGSDSDSTGSVTGSRRDTSRAAGVFFNIFFITLIFFYVFFRST